MDKCKNCDAKLNVGEQDIYEIYKNELKNQKHDEAKFCCSDCLVEYLKDEYIVSNY